jgi:hypothetical protein
VPASTPRGKLAGLLADAGRVDANRRPPRTATGKASSGKQMLAVVLASSLNPFRTAVFTSAPFAGGPVTAKAKPGSPLKLKAKPKAKAKAKAKKPVKKKQPAKKTKKPAKKKSK